MKNHMVTIADKSAISTNRNSTFKCDSPRSSKFTCDQRIADKSATSKEKRNSKFTCDSIAGKPAISKINVIAHLCAIKK